MSDFNRAAMLRAEIQEVDGLIDGLPTDHVIERLGLESRRDDLMDELRAAETPPPGAVGSIWEGPRW